jgi:hypothetical protein
MVWLCSTKKALRGFRMSKNLSSTFATTFWFTFSSYTPKALSTSSLYFMAFLPPFPLKGNSQGVNFLTRLLVRIVEVQMVSSDALPTPQRTQMWAQVAAEERGVGAHSLAHNPLRGRRAGWSSGMGLGRVDKLHSLTQACTRPSQSG